MDIFKTKHNLICTENDIANVANMVDKIQIARL